MQRSKSTCHLVAMAVKTTACSHLLQNIKKKKKGPRYTFPKYFFHLQRADTKGFNDGNPFVMVGITMMAIPSRLAPKQSLKTNTSFSRFLSHIQTLAQQLKLQGGVKTK